MAPEPGTRNPEPGTRNPAPGVVAVAHLVLAAVPRRWFAAVPRRWFAAVPRRWFAAVPRRWFDEDLMPAIDQPPLTPLLARLADTVAPGAQLVLAVPAVVATAAAVLLVALMARELGADARAQTPVVHRCPSDHDGRGGDSTGDLRGTGARDDDDLDARRAHRAVDGDPAGIARPYAASGPVTPRFAQA